jgi:nucleoside-diphosphate-sugar epimerase
MKVLVTGYKGFIGSRVYSHLVGLGFDVTGIDFPVDIGNFAAYSDLYEPKFDVVIHLAAFAALRDSIDNPDKFWENNVVKSQPIFDYCRENNIRLLYASSAGAHGWWQNPYAITKKVNEIQAPPDSVGMRFFNVWAEEGSRSDMLYRMLEEGTAKYLTRHRRDWIHVDDVVSAIGHLIPSTHTGPIDIGTGQETSVLELANAMGKGNLPIKEDTPGEPDTLCADTRSLTELGWSPTINILDRVKEITNDRTM